VDAAASDAAAVPSTLERQHRARTSQSQRMPLFGVFFGIFFYFPSYCFLVCLHCVLASGAVYCNRSCLFVCGFVGLLSR